MPPSPIAFARPDREHEALASLLEEAAARVICGGRSILGPEVAAFESEFAAFLRAPFVVGTSSGTDALVTALHALEVGPGDEVIIAAFGFVAGAEAIVRVGAKPVFVDIEPSAIGLDGEGVRAALSGRTKAIVSTDLFGVVHDLSPLREMTPGTPIVEDAAQALGSSSYDTPAGCHGDIGTFSFFPSKSLGAIGDAGACVTREPKLAARIRSARTHGSEGGYEWLSPGGNYRLDELQAAFLRIKLGCLPARLERRRAIGETLAATALHFGAQPVVGREEAVIVHAPLALRIEGGRRDTVLAALRSHDIDARVHYPRPVASSPAFIRFAEGRHFPAAQKASEELLSLPCHPELTDGEVLRLDRALAEVLGGR